MRRSVVLVLLAGTGTLLAFWILLQTPGSLGEALSHPFQTLLGTQRRLNSTLLEASENAEPVRAASRRLLQPLGVVRLVRIYEPADTDPSKKR
jgi:hypothetical protein